MKQILHTTFQHHPRILLVNFSLPLMSSSLNMILIHLRQSLLAQLLICWASVFQTSLLNSLLYLSQVLLDFISNFHLVLGIFYFLIWLMIVYLLEVFSFLPFEISWLNFIKFILNVLIWL